MEQTEKQLKVFGFGMPVLLAFLGLRHWHKHSFDTLALALLVGAAVFLLMTFFYQRGLRIVFKYWMLVAGAIGHTVTSAILTVVFFLIFTPVALVLKLRRRDFLSRQRDFQTVSYWLECRSSAREDYVRQF